MGEPQLVIVSRGRGRPKAKEQGSSVSTWIPETQHDFLVRLADERSTSVSQVLRDLVDTAHRVVQKRRAAVKSPGLK
jgi:hypothetical protein